MVKSRYGIYTYVNLIFNFIFIVAIVYICFILNPWKRSEKIPVPNVFIAIFLLFFVFLFLHKLLKIALNISISDKHIKVAGIFTKTREINSDEIGSIDLFSKANYFWFIGQETIATKIELNNGEKIMIADPFYRNIGMIKQTIAENFKEKIKPYKTEKVGVFFESLQIKEVRKFSGNPVTSFNTLLYAGFIVSMIFLSFLPNKVHDIKLVVLFLFVLLYFGFGSQMHYFLIDEKYLIVKNHYFFWFKKYYRIEDIIAASFESPYRRSEALRVITNDFKSRLYGAGSLRSKHWIQLKERFEASGIKVIK